MPTARHRIPLTALASAALLVLALTGCGVGSDAGSDPADSGTTDQSTDTDDSNGTDDSGSSDDSGTAYVTLSGTGTYTIPDQMPFGGYQLQGEPDSQPAGCTWSIQDASGGHTFENQGPYVFITDIPEGVTFVTEGCPDWEQFE